MGLVDPQMNIEDNIKINSVKYALPIRIKLEEIGKLT